MLNLLSNNLQPLAAMAGALIRSAQFNHVSEDNIVGELTWLYENPDRVFYKTNEQKAVSYHLVRALNDGHLREMVFDPIHTAGYLASIQGRTCSLCFNVEMNSSYANTFWSHDDVILPEQTLMVDAGEDDGGIRPATNPFCMPCHAMLVRRVNKKYASSGSEMAFNAALSEIMTKPEFKERCKKGRIWKRQHKFDISFAVLSTNPPVASAKAQKQKPNSIKEG